MGAACSSDAEQQRISLSRFMLLRRTRALVSAGVPNADTLTAEVEAARTSRRLRELEVAVRRVEALEESRRLARKR